MLLPALWLLLPIAAADAAPATDALLAKLVRPAPATTAFVEVRFSELVTEPLVSRGELSFDVGGRLGKRVDAPFKETTTIAGENVRVERAGRKPMQFNLRRAPELRALVAGFSGLLGGDGDALRKHFKVSVNGDDAAWRITLDAVDARTRKRLPAIEVLGAGAAPRCFRLQEAGGDASVMLVDDAAASALPEPLTPDALRARCHG
jgi:hypothetical protein